MDCPAAYESESNEVEELLLLDVATRGCLQALISSVLVNQPLKDMECENDYAESTFYFLII